MLMITTAVAAGPNVVQAPGADVHARRPRSAKTKYFQGAARKGSYRIALVNGYVGNTWRIQMIKTAKAFAESADVKRDIKGFKVVSVGVDAAAQLGAIEDFSNQGYDAIISTLSAPPDSIAWSAKPTRKARCWRRSTIGSTPIR